MEIEMRKVCGSATEQDRVEFKLIDSPRIFTPEQEAEARRIEKEIEDMILEKMRRDVEKQTNHQWDLLNRLINDPPGGTKGMWENIDDEGATTIDLDESEYEIIEE
jgi:hypothetical protein